MVDVAALVSEFRQRFNEAPRLYRAPGRVNLIGEHTDYNDGFALPMALDRSTWVAAAPRRDRRLVAVSHAYHETFTVDLDNHPAYPTGSWIDYVRGVAAVLSADGADLLIASDVPIGAGVSSSAALEIACGFALLDVAGRPVDLDALARAGQRAEHEFVDMRCGLMDQLTACHARARSALLLDTRTFGRRLVQIPQSMCVIVANTMVRHALASSEYNQRRADCEAGVLALGRRFPRVHALRDITVDRLDEARDELTDSVFRRCRHVVSENARTLAAADALASGDLASVGRLMDQSHISLRDDYEVSCRELDTMVTMARACDGVYGARMMGGGFGGSAVVLADADRADDIATQLRVAYAAATGLEPDVWTCSAGNGVERFDERRTASAL